MNMTGWYPDPGGSPGRYRYWDGSTWSERTVTDPGEPAPSSPQPAPRPPTPPRRGAVLGILALVIVLVIAGLLVRQRTEWAATSMDPSGTGSRSTGWDDSTPLPTPPGNANETPRPSASVVPCPVGNPDGRAAHPDDNRVHGGNLSFAEVDSFDSAANEKRFSFAHDVTQQTRHVSDDPAWLAQLAVGQLLSRDGFTGNARASAESVTQCLINTNMYQPNDPVRTDVRSQAVRISGQRSWLIESNVTVEQEGLPFAGDHVVVIVVPDGDNWGVFFGAVPIGDVKLGKVLKATVADLRID